MSKTTAPKTKTKQKAVIYCRVSDKKQLVKGDGLNSQRTRCNEFAKHKAYDVVDVFQDKGISGGLIDRPGMQQMLSFLRKHKQHTNHVVIIDDISRLARDLMAHIQLRTEISDAGGILESPSVEFGEDSDSILVENLLASVSQHHRQKNAEQVTNRMRARIMNGYWVFQAPIGYRYKKSSTGGKILIPDEPNATLVRECLERFADGRFESQADIKRYLNGYPSFPRYSNGEIHFQKIRLMLERPIYAGYIEAPKWNVPLLKAKHEPLISFETYQRIQQRLQQHSKTPARKAIKEDFPLRGYVSCAECNETMTAAWAKGRNTKYPYYYCFNKQCSQHRKSIRKERLEKDFEHLLARLKPNPDVFAMMHNMLKDAWDEREANAKDKAKELKNEINLAQRKIDQIMERILECVSTSLMQIYEDQVKKLHEQQISIKEKLTETGQSQADFDQTFRTAMTFLSNPWNLWVSDDPADQQSVLKLVFEENLLYHRNGGFRTAKTTLPFKVLEAFNDNRYEMVSPEGFEPSTY